MALRLSLLDSAPSLLGSLQIPSSLEGNSRGFCKLPDTGLSNVIATPSVGREHDVGLHPQGGEGWGSHEQWGPRGLLEEQLLGSCGQLNGSPDPLKPGASSVPNAGATS